jgi:3-hydroxyisobutyrate dehydrogenase
MQRITLLGVGAMGGGMAANWLAKRFAVTVWNRTPAKTGPLAAKGAGVAVTPREAARDADIVVAMVADDEASRHVWLGSDGALAGARRGAVAIEMSTLSPGWVRALAAQAKDAGLDFLDSPVGGSKGAAAAGQLVLFVGGEAATLDRVRPALEAVSGQIHHLGPTGAGATWKIINNMMVAIQVAASAEALALAEKAGFDRRKVAAIIAGSGLASPLVKMKMARMGELAFGEPDFLLRHMGKDLRYAEALAGQFGARADLALAAAGYYRHGEEQGHGEEDFAAVLAALRS